jgi:hypothetical protein
MALQSAPRAAVRIASVPAMAPQAPDRSADVSRASGAARASGATARPVDSLDAFHAYDADAQDADDRVVLFDERGALSGVHAETVAVVGRRLRGVDAVVTAEACLPASRDAARAVRDGVARELEAAGVRAWTLRIQPARCSLPGAVVLRTGV